jgi:hypothetical protein
MKCNACDSEELKKSEFGIICFVCGNVLPFSLVLRKDVKE